MNKLKSDTDNPSIEDYQEIQSLLKETKNLKHILLVNDPPESFSIVYPTITDTTFSFSTDTDEILKNFSWEESVDVDSEKMLHYYSIHLDYFGQIMQFIQYESYGPMVEVSHL